MKFANAKVEEKLIGLGVLAIKDQLFSRGAFWSGRLDDPRFDVRGVFDSSDSVTTTVFDLSSMTKALMTTPLALRTAWALGRDATDTLEAVFPGSDFSGMESARNLVLADVLRHEAGLPAWRNFFVECSDTQARRDVRQVLDDAIRNRFLDHRNVYSDPDMILLGLLLESSSGTSVAELFLNFIREDLAVDPDKITLGPSWLHQSSDCVDTGYCAVRRRVLQGEVHDENAWALGGFTGHTGLFGSVESVVQYLRAFAGSRVGRRVICENSQWAARHEKSDSALGWRTGRDSSSNTFGEGRGIGHMGFTGTAFWIDPKTNFFAVLLTNRVAMARTANMSAMRIFRREVFDTMFQHLNSARALNP